MAPPDPNDYVILEVANTAELPRFDLVGFVDPENGYSNRAKSKIIWEEDNSESIDQVNELVILANKLPEKSAFFRIKYLGGALVVHKNVVAALAALRAQPFEVFPLLEYMTGPTGRPMRRAADGTWNLNSIVTEYDPPAKTKAKETPKVKSPPFPKVLDPWVGKPVRLMTTGGEIGWGERDAKNKWVVKPIDGIVFCWKNTSKMLRELLLEAMGPAAQEEVLGGALVPFAVLGNTEESGEKLTLENLLDVQNEGVLFYDATLAVHHDDEGHLSAKEVKVKDIKVTGATTLMKKRAPKPAPKKKKRK